MAIKLLHGEQTVDEMAPIAKQFIFKSVKPFILSIVNKLLTSSKFAVIDRLFPVIAIVENPNKL